MNEQLLKDLPVNYISDKKKSKQLFSKTDDDEVKYQ